MDYARQRKHSQVVELLEMAEIRIALRAKRLEDEDALVELVPCSQVSLSGFLETHLPASSFPWSDIYTLFPTRRVVVSETSVRTLGFMRPGAAPISDRVASNVGS